MPCVGLSSSAYGPTVINARDVSDALLVVAQHHWRRQSPSRYLIVLRPMRVLALYRLSVGGLEAAWKVAAPTSFLVCSGLDSQLPPLAVTSPWRFPNILGAVFPSVVTRPLTRSPR